MATKNVAVVTHASGRLTATWTGLTEADTGQSAALGEWPDRTVQVTGDFVTAGAVTIEGSNNNVDFATLHDFLGNALVITDSTVYLIAENPIYVRPRATAGTAVLMDVVIHGAK